MRISDWSSDVCSSDLRDHAQPARIVGIGQHLAADRGAALGHVLGRGADVHHLEVETRRLAQQRLERGRVLQSRHLHDDAVLALADDRRRSEEHTSELQSLMRISYAVFFLKKKKNK